MFHVPYSIEDSLEHGTRVLGTRIIPRSMEHIQSMEHSVEHYMEHSMEQYMEKSMEHSMEDSTEDSM